VLRRWGARSTHKENHAPGVLDCLIGANGQRIAQASVQFQVMGQREVSARGTPRLRRGRAVRRGDNSIPSAELMDACDAFVALRGRTRKAQQHFGGAGYER